MYQELKVISDFYDLMLYLIQRIEKFPRHHRYSLVITRPWGSVKFLAHIAGED